MTKDRVGILSSPHWIDVAAAALPALVFAALFGLAMYRAYWNT